MTDQSFTEEGIRETAAEAADALAEHNALKGLGHPFEESPLRNQAGQDRYSRLAGEYNWIARHAPAALSPHIYFGKEFIACGLYKQACVALERAIKLKPDAADAHCLYARALAMLNRLEEASTAYQEAMRLDAHLLEARFESEIVKIRSEERE